MKVLVALLLLSFSGTSMAVKPAHVSHEAWDKLSPNMMGLIGKIFKKKKKKTSALIVFKEQADLKGAKAIQDRNERLQFVYNQLTTVAKKYVGTFDDVAREMEGVEFKQFYIVNMYAVYNANESDILKLAERADVEKVIVNPKFKALPEVRKTAIPAWELLSALEAGSNIQSVGADKVWDEFSNNGEGIVIAGQDTGVDWDHPGLKRQYRGWDGKNASHDYNWHDAIQKPISSTNNKCGYGSKQPCDDHEHGTHTIGTVLGAEEGGKNQVGVAPGAQWIACRNMDAGDGRPSTYIDCFEFFLAPYPLGGNPLTDGAPAKAPHVINNSWGCPESEGCHDAEILPVLEVLKSAGIFVVASAGNEGPGCKSIAAPPAMHTEETFSIGAHDHSDGKIASFSSRGPSIFDGGIGPDVTAPGVNIRSTVPGGGYSGFFWSGTSMAGPHVVGQVALMWAQNKDLIGDFEKTAEIIRVTAKPTKSDQSCGGVSGDQIPNNTFGYGQINVYESVKLSRTLLGEDEVEQPEEDEAEQPEEDETEQPEEGETEQPEEDGTEQPEEGEEQRK